MTKEDKTDALAELYKAIPRGWIVGRPPFDASAGRWRLFAYERRSSVEGLGPLVTSEAGTEHEAVRQMTRKLRTTAATRRPPRRRH